MDERNRLDDLDETYTLITQPGANVNARGKRGDPSKINPTKNDSRRDTLHTQTQGHRRWSPAFPASPQHAQENNVSVCSTTPTPHEAL